ncbi:MAG TPA: pyridoxal phosphate-dependent aminotransferase [Bryobacteraceae bacterium]|nr:pyridoxal phosphate-dependent aminotransferase [Bryobacteraceae bacterium]
MQRFNLCENEKRELLQRGFSRRKFGRIAALLSAGAALPFYNESALAQFSKVSGGVPPDAVKIDANENPLGPCSDAVDAIHSVVAKGGRYQYELTDTMQQTLAESESLPVDHVLAFAGSSLPLHLAVIAFASPRKSLVTADPGYEAPVKAAQFIGAKVVNVPLTKTYAHDVKAMAQADPNAGIIYLCNPNNPTGTLTSRSDIEWLLANKPAGSILLVDEAYIHFTDAPRTADLVAAGKDIIVLRTFSKIYGMAGLRAGAALARPDLLKRFSDYSAGALPITAMVGATASLKSKTVVPERSKYIRDVRENTLEFLDKHRFTYVPSVSNKFMVDVKRPGGEIIQAMRREKVYIGRVWPSMPTYVRVTVGTKEEMEKFKAAFLKVMA